MLLVDLSSKKIDGARVDLVMDLVNISANKNTIPGDKSALVPSGIRLGTPAMTTRGFGEKEFEKTAEYIDRAVEITKQIKNKTGKKLSDFKTYVSENGNSLPEVKELKEEVKNYAKDFGYPS